MRIQTQSFGEVQVEPEGVLHLHDGLPGLPRTRHCYILDRDEEYPVRWLLDARDPSVAMPIVEASFVCPGYDPPLPRSEERSLLLGPEDARRFFLVLVIPADPRGITANLRAPIVVNERDRTGKQVLLASEEYPIRYRLFPGGESGCGG